MANNVLKPDFMKISEVADRLGMSRRWLETRLKTDENGECVLQFHKYMGRSKVWEENDYQALKEAVTNTPSKSTHAMKSSGSVLCPHQEQDPTSARKYVH